MKNILIINGHPDKESLCTELANQYKSGADASGANVTLLNLIDLDFDPILRYGYRQRTELEPDLLEAQSQIKKADHIVVVSPTWWGTVPALLKGFFDRVFLPGFAFQSHNDSVKWDKLLAGKTGRLIITMDAPSLYDRIAYRAAGRTILKRSVFGFCGVKTIGTSTFGMVKKSTPEKREKWKKQVNQLGVNLN